MGFRFVFHFISYVSIPSREENLSKFGGLVIKKRFFLKKIYDLLFIRTVGKLFYQARRHALSKQTLLGRAITSLNQTLNEKGATPPWISSASECAEFWRTLDNSSASTGNRPQKYSHKKSAIIDFLHQFWMPYVAKDDTVIELGCNCGVNLHWLQQLGYSRLNGAEINPHAIEQMKTTFPELYRNSTLFEGSIENFAKATKANTFDVVFTVGVSQHIHPAHNYLFAEMVRVCKKYICTIEPETANSNYVFARNYRRIFESCGCVQLQSARITEAICADPGYAGCSIRLLKKIDPA